MPEASSGPRVVVGVDGSEPSKLALRWAARVAEATGATIEAVAAWSYPVGYTMAAVPAEWNPQNDTQQMLTDTVTEVLADHKPGTVTAIVREGGAAQALLDVSKGATMLIVGSRGHGGFAGLLLGSVSSNVAEHADCPVLVVHGDEPPPLRP